MKWSAYLLLFLGATTFIHAEEENTIYFEEYSDDRESFYFDEYNSQSCYGEYCSSDAYDERQHRRTNSRQPSAKNSPPCAPCHSDRNAWMKQACNRWSNSCQDCYDWKLRYYADFLYFMPDATGLAYGVDYDSGKIQNLNFDWHAAYRIGLLVRYCPEWCQANISWMSFCDSTKSSHCGNLILAWDIGELPFETETKVSYSLSISTLDTEFGHSLTVAKNFTFTPHIGIRCARVKQKYTLSSTDNFVLLRSNQDDNEDILLTLDMHNLYKGLGLRSGFHAECALGECGFGFYGEAAGSLIFGRFNVRQQLEIELDIFEQEIIEEGFFQSSKLNSTNAIADLSLGFSWENRFDPRCRYAFGLRMGWEGHLFFDVNQLQTIPALLGNPPRGNVAIQGLAVSAVVKF